jgi:6-pyruvoyltetrahydropterin/6-carboxytetrahydropterin synthase
LKRIITINLTYVLDHRNINVDVAFMKGKMASTEVLAVTIFEVLKPHIDGEGAILHSVKLFETENNFVEYFG